MTTKQRRRLTNLEVVRNIFIGAFLTLISFYCLGLTFNYSLFKHDRVTVLNMVDRLGWTQQLTSEWNQIMSAEAEFISNHSILEFALELPAPVQILGEFASFACFFFGVAVLSANTEKLLKRWKAFNA